MGQKNAVYKNVSSRSQNNQIMWGKKHLRMGQKGDILLELPGTKPENSHEVNKLPYEEFEFKNR